MFIAFSILISLLFFLSADFYQNEIDKKLQVIYDLESKAQLKSIMNITLLNALFAFTRVKNYIDQQAILVNRLLSSQANQLFDTTGLCITSLSEFKNSGRSLCSDYRTG